MLHLKNMKFNHVPAVLKLLNPHCLNPEIPCFPHLKVGTQIFLLKNFNHQLPQIITPSTYLEFPVIICGEVSVEKGHFPNPMVEFQVIEISEIQLYEV